MHCRSCEILIEKNLLKVPGIKKVRGSYKKGIIEIESETDQPDSKSIERAINLAGYALGKDDKKHFFSRNPADYKQLGLAVVIFLVFYVVFKLSGIGGLSINVGSTPGLIGVLVVGLTAGVSSCMALVGGLVLAISSRHAELHPEASTAQKFRPHIFFNFGRLTSYVVLGGLIGLIGSGLRLSSPVIGTLIVGIGIVMLFFGLKLIEIFPRLTNKNISLPASVSRLFGLGNDVKEYSHRGAFITGAATFFVPCGFTQAMQLYAISTGSFLSGALIMGTFAVGTLPGIAGIGGLTSVIKGTFARYFFKFAGLVVIALALFNISTGFNLTGLSLPSIPSFNLGQSASAAGTVTIENGKQIVEMNQLAAGYSPNQFTIKKGIPVVWNIQSETQFSCTAYISMPSAGIAQPLHTGLNTIEFTPTATGQLRFTCAMGMYSGNFNVID